MGVFGEQAKGNALGKVLVVSELPRKAGVDPFNKLIDRTPEDNVRAVELLRGSP